MSDQRDDQRPRAPTGQDAAVGRSSGEHAEQRYPQPYGQPYGGPSYGQQYGTQHYGGQQYGGPQYGLPPYAQPPYGPYGGPGRPGVPARPGSVITSAVLAFVYASLGLLMAVSTLAFGAVFDDLIGVLQESDESLGGVAPAEVDAARAGLIAFGLIALAWTVVMVWGAVLAVRGRSRVLLLVGGSISIAVTGLLLAAGVVGATDPQSRDAVVGVVFFLLLFLGALAIVVLLCLRSAGRYFAAHRARRA